MNFKDLKLDHSLCEVLRKLGYKKPTPIQKTAIPVIIEGRDVLGIAQTGTGKTAAFSLPIINHLIKKTVNLKKRETKVLIITPTRELASQINSHIEKYKKGHEIKNLVIYGGVNKNKQIQEMEKGAHIVVATPGRLLDLMEEGALRANDLDILVLDEADRMLDMGFITDVKKILEKVNIKRQTLLFSASMPKEIGELSMEFLKDPMEVKACAPSMPLDNISQALYFVEAKRKIYLLEFLINEFNAKHIIVFTKTKKTADRLARNLMKLNIKAVSIHGDKSQKQRELALSDFKKFKAKVLVATDIAARGIDITTIDYVFNYNIPMEADSYLHRIGRTGRIGRKGVSISFCDPVEKKFLNEVEKTINQKIPVVDLPQSILDLIIN